MSFYGEDLAHVHDRGFSGFVRDALEGLAALLEAEGVRSGLVVDLGCGGGLWLARLLELGYDALGVDVSPAFVAMSRARAPGARVLEASAFDVELPPCRAITAIGECLNYLGQSRAEERLEGLLPRLHAALAPGGVLVFDLALPGRVGREPRRSRTSGDDWTVLVEVEERGASLVRRITTLRRHGSHERRSDEVHRQRLLPARDVLAALEAAGFDARMLDRYGPRPFPPGLAAFVARKA